jgi:hypothetical protein
MKLFRLMTDPDSPSARVGVVESSARLDAYAALIRNITICGSGAWRAWDNQTAAAPASFDVAMPMKKTESASQKERSPEILPPETP